MWACSGRWCLGTQVAALCGLGVAVERGGRHVSRRRRAGSAAVPARGGRRFVCGGESEEADACGHPRASADAEEASQLGGSLKGVDGLIRFLYKFTLSLYVRKHSDSAFSGL